VARVDGRGVGAATLAYRTADLDMLEGRSDLVVLWEQPITANRRSL
jgi:hypothetical protein